MWEIHRRRQQVFGERTTDQRSGLVVDCLLVQGLGDTLRQTAVHLALHDQGVHHVPDIVDAHVLPDAHMAGLGVDLDGAQVGAVREREVVGVVGGLGIEVRFDSVGQVVRSEHRECDVGERNCLLGALHLESAPGEFEVVLGTFHQVRGDRPGLATTFSAALTTAIPPTASERDPYVSSPRGDDWVSPCRISMSSNGIPS